MAIGDAGGGSHATMPGEEQALDSPRCGCESQLCHLLWDLAQITQPL